MKQSTVFVTGATGFIGSHLVRVLLEKGDAKVVASNTSGSRRNLEDVQDRLEFVRADVGSFTSVLRMIETHRPETIYHIGAMLAPACERIRRPAFAPMRWAPTISSRPRACSGCDR